MPDVVLAVSCTARAPASFREMTPFSGEVDDRRCIYDLIQNRNCLCIFTFCNRLYGEEQILANSAQALRPLSLSSLMQSHYWHCDRQHSLAKRPGHAHKVCADVVLKQHSNELAACNEERQTAYLVFKVGRREALGRLNWVDAAHTAANAQLQVEHQVVAAVTLVDRLTWSSRIALPLHIHQQRSQPHRDSQERRNY